MLQIIISKTSNHSDPTFCKQKTAEWFNVCKGKINGSKAVTALGWYGKKAMNDYWSDLSNDLHAGVPTKGGSINEDSALVTYLNKFLAKNKDDLILRETGIWLLSDKKNQSWLGSSPDGMIELNGKRRRILEMKRPFMRGKPIPYKNVCINHIDRKSVV